MAYFAQIDSNNVVQRVISIDDSDCSDIFGTEYDEVGSCFCKKHVNAPLVWKQASYNKRIRKNFPSEGYLYDSENDFFYPPRPTDSDGDVCNSWTLNTTTAQWEPPIEYVPETPEESAANTKKRWDESAYQADNTTGWVVETPE